MARAFYTSTVASDLSSGGNFSNRLFDAQEAVNTIVLTAPQASTAAGSYFTASGVPGTGGTSTGTFTIRTNITQSNTGINFRANLMRVNSAGTVQATVLGTYLAASTGTRTQDFVNPALGTWASGDRLRIQYEIDNTNAHGGDKGITFETGQLAQDTPFAAGAVTVTDDFALDAVVERTQTGSLALDSIVLREQAATFATDAILQRIQTDSLALDAIVFVSVTGSFGLDSAFEAAPSGGPVWTTPLDLAVLTDTTPTLAFMSPVSSNDMHFEIQLDTVDTFDSGDLRVYRSFPDDTGWEYDDGGWTPISIILPAAATGSEVRFTVPDALTTGTWYRRVRATI